jgi:hypothetical protein
MDQLTHDAQLDNEASDLVYVQSRRLTQIICDECYEAR